MLIYYDQPRERAGPKAKKGREEQENAHKHSQCNVDDFVGADETKVIGWNPNLWPAYNSRGEAYGRLGQYQKAIEDFTKSISVNPRSAAAYRNRAEMYARLGKHDLAQQDREMSRRLGFAGGN